MIQQGRQTIWLLQDKVVPFMIICKETQLSMKVGNPFNAIDSKVIACQPDIHDLSQLWFLSKIKGGQSEITNSITGLVMEEQNGIIYLRKGKQKASQLFYFVKVKNLKQQNDNYFIIKPSKGSTQALCQYGALLSRQFVASQQHFIFEFQSAEASLPLVMSCTITNAYSDKVLDIPESSFQVGRGYIQYSYHGKLNQRWIFLALKGPNCFKIKSLMNAMVMETQHSSKSSGTKIVQNVQTQQLNQEWQVRRNRGGFTIKSVHSGLFMGVAGDSKNDEAQICLVSDHSNSCVWHLFGKEPEL